VAVFALRIMPGFEDHGTEAAPAPPDCAVLFRIVALLIDQVHLIEDFLRLFQTDAVLPSNGPALLTIELEAYLRI